MTSKYVRKNKKSFIVCLWHTLLHCHWDFWTQIFPLFLLSYCGLLRLCIIIFILFIHKIVYFITYENFISSFTRHNLPPQCFYTAAFPVHIFFSLIIFCFHNTRHSLFFICSQHFLYSQRSTSNRYNTQGKYKIILKKILSNRHTKKQKIFSQFAN